jgi:hypothetical protein
MAAIRMECSSLPINSSLQNNPRYKFSLKSENIENLPILSAAICPQFFLCQHILPTLLNIYAKLVEIPLAVSDISEVKDFDIRSRFPWQRDHFENSKTRMHLLRWGFTFL